MTHNSTIKPKHKDQPTVTVSGFLHEDSDLMFHLPDGRVRFADGFWATLKLMWECVHAGYHIEFDDEDEKP